MKKFAPVLVIGIALAIPSHAATLSIGPSVGFDVYSASGSSLVVVSAPVGSDVIIGGLRPGLRLGLRDATGQHTAFTDVSMMSLSGSGSTWSSFSGTINYAYAFREGTSPYITAGIGFANTSFDNDSETATMIGGGVGVRRALGHGHGAVRLEGRYDRADSQSFSEPVNILGMRVGFDLDLQ
jgi:hypothetical protein